MVNRFARLLSVLFGAVLCAAGAGSALAQFVPPPNFVGTTFEGCRNDGNPVIPPNTLICPDAAYTSGNLGKGWNELDLVPFHLITSSGNQAGPSTTYNIYIAADYQYGTLGYDFISVPTVNPVSDASCSVTASDPQTVVSATGITGGTDYVVYRLLTITQTQGKSCRFDWYQRLAIGAAQFSGSNLQAYIFDQANLSGGKRTIPIPVNQILPQKLSKDMAASQGSDHTWNVTKSPTVNTLNFGDVCAATPTTSLPVQITVSWTKSAAIAGKITVTTNVYATNPSNRTITTTVTDAIYSGTTLLDTSAPATQNVPANTANSLMLTHSITVDAGTTDLNDIATATYTDLVTNVPVPGTTTATASAPVQQTGPELNASAVITDLEQISGTGLTYSVATPSLGSFLGYPLLTDPAYVAGTETNGFVNWGTTSQPGDGSVTFNKSVYLTPKQITTGTLSDAASLVGSSGYAATSGPVSINISSTAKATLTINKSYSGFTLQPGEKLVFNFHVTRANDASYSADTSIELTGGGSTSGSATLSGLTPDSYTVVEGNAIFYPKDCTDSTVPTCKAVVPLQDENSPNRTVSLLPDEKGIATCTGAASYNNVLNLLALPHAAVNKVTIPNPPSATTTTPANWEFKLYDPDGKLLDTKTAIPNGATVDFTPALSVEGKYTVVETTPVTGWDLTSAAPNDGVSNKVCSFTVNFPQDAVDKVFQCTFTNTQRGKAQVAKTVQGAVPSGTQAYTFELREGASTTSDGTIDETVVANAANGGTIAFSTLLVPGKTYQICEWVFPGWNTNLAGDGALFVPNSIIPPALPNPNAVNLIVCTNFTVTAGQTRTFTVDNSPPPGGRGLTIGFWKNWASCKTSGGGQKPTLDATLYGYLPNGIPVGKVVSVVNGQLGFFGQTVTATADCAHAVSLLNKSDFSGKKQASDPLFNMAAQLVGAELNGAAGAYSCPVVVNAITQANLLLSKYNFTGFGYTPKLSSTDATAANNLATKLDDYNNNRPSACP